MSSIRIEKDIYLRDRYGVKRREWVAGQNVDSYVYHAVLKTNTAINPEDLPVEPQLAFTPSLNTSMMSAMETKVLPEVVEEPKEEVKEVVVKKPQPKNKKKKK